MNKKLNFQIEVSRVLEILSNDIYDSPYALLRENIQNAYDAILMRISLDNNQDFIPKIEVTITDSTITILDNGIGMDEEILQNNFWKAGSSGKNNEEAKKAGVVGTFGIGAMANFGVANKLTVISRKLNTNLTIKTFAERANLSITEECVDFEIIDEQLDDYGTKIEVNMDNKLDVNAAINYLLPYVQYLKIPVILNNNIISQREFHSLFRNNSTSIDNEENFKIVLPNFTCNFKYILNSNGMINIFVENIVYNNTQLKGEMVLFQGGSSIYGLRNYFGLAPIPLLNNFDFGGIINLNILHPTAGREALSRESISLVTNILSLLENEFTIKISEFDVIDKNNKFLAYILNHNKLNLSGKILIDLKPGDEKIQLKDIKDNFRGKKTYYYTGRDSSVILAFANENSYLFNVSQVNPRRSIQLHKLKQLKIAEVPDKPDILKIYEKDELDFSNIAILLRITNILSSDYLLPNTKIYFATISHQVPNIIKQNGDIIEIYLDKESPNIKQLLKTYDSAYEVFDGFIKDYIRNHLYQKLAEFIPSSTRAGADALQKILLKNKELFKYDTSDLGEIDELDSLISDYISGEIEFSEVLKKSSTIRKIQTQQVDISQVGKAEDEIPNLTEPNSNDVALESEFIQKEINGESLIYSPLPSIIRNEASTNKKLLKTDKRYQHLNGFSMFLRLSNRVYKRELDFFLEPHTTKVIWGMHRIVYIFTHASNKLSLYYDIELKERLMNNDTGGKAIPSTTIITDGAIFIPILQELEDYFDITEGSKEFFVRHDIIVDLNK